MEERSRYYFIHNQVPLVNFHGLKDGKKKKKIRVAKPPPEKSNAFDRNGQRVLSTADGGWIGAQIELRERRLWPHRESKPVRGV